MIDVLTPLAATNFTNASNSLSHGMGSAYGLFGVASIVVLMSFALFVGSKVSRIEWVHKKLIAFSESLYYTVVGIASTVVLSIFVAPVYLLSKADGETQQWVLVVIGGLITAYVVFTILGYIVDRLIVTNLREYVSEKESE